MKKFLESVNNISVWERRGMRRTRNEFKASLGQTVRLSLKKKSNIMLGIKQILHTAANSKIYYWPFIHREILEGIKNSYIVFVHIWYWFNYLQHLLSLNVWSHTHTRTHTHLDCIFDTSISVNFCLALNSISLSGYIMIYLTTNPLKNILMAFILWWFE